jgi:general stress protein 26
MKNTSLRKLFVFVLAALFIPFVVSAQNTLRSEEISRDSLLKMAKLIVDSSRCKVLVSVDEEGKPHVREMDPFSPDEGFVIWFGTSPNSRKVSQIKNNHNVAVYYYDARTLSYVSINGKAELVNDQKEKEKHWKEYWKVYYPDRDKDMVLIKVIPQRLELISYRYKIFWKSDSYMPQFIEFDN